MAEKICRETGETFRSERAVGAVMVARNSRFAQVPDLWNAVIDRHMVQLAELRDRRLALFAGDEMAAEVGQLRQRGLVLILEFGEYRPHPRSGGTPTEPAIRWCCRFLGKIR